MTSRSQPDSADSERRVADAVRLLHRRRGWAWTATGSLAGLVVYTVVGALFFGDLTGVAEAVSIAVLPLLLVVGLAGVIAVMVDTARLRRAGPHISRLAQSQTSHRRLGAHASRFPPHHLASWLFGWLILASWMLVAAVFLPGLVNSAAYLTGLSPTGTFVPVDYGQACSKGGCSVVTKGYLQGTGTDVTWGGQVPLSKPFTVREPVWDWGIGHNLIGGAGTAIGMLAFCLFFDGTTVLGLYAVAKMGWHAVQRRLSVQHVSLDT